MRVARTALVLIRVSLARICSSTTAQSIKQLIRNSQGILNLIVQQHCNSPPNTCLPLACHLSRALIYLYTAAFRTKTIRYTDEFLRKKSQPCVQFFQWIVPSTLLSILFELVFNLVFNFTFNFVFNPQRPQPNGYGTTCVVLATSTRRP